MKLIEFKLFSGNENTIVNVDKINKIMPHDNGGSLLNLDMRTIVHVADDYNTLIEKLQSSDYYRE